MDTRVYYSCCGQRFNRGNKTEAELLELYKEHVKTCPEYAKMVREEKMREEEEDKKYERKMKRRGKKVGV